jgi:hypothetical protein
VRRETAKLRPTSNFVQPLRGVLLLMPVMEEAGAARAVVPNTNAHIITSSTCPRHIAKNKRTTEPHLDRRAHGECHISDHSLGNKRIKIHRTGDAYPDDSLRVTISI